jgi:hypothetical protein
MTARVDLPAIAGALGGVVSNGRVVVRGPAVNRNFRVRTLSNREQVEALRCEVSRHRRPLGRSWPMDAPDRQTRDAPAVMLRQMRMCAVAIDACAELGERDVLAAQKPDFGSTEKEGKYDQ